LKRNIVIYFHEYRSNANSDNVNRLNVGLTDCEVYAFDINPNPNISIPELEKEIDSVLMDNPNAEYHLHFVGTSLGAWYAEHMSNEYVPHVSNYLINPLYDPFYSLQKYKVADSILYAYEHYDPIRFKSHDHLYLSLNDSVIDHSHYEDYYGMDNGPILRTFENTDHEFNGPEFRFVIEDIKNNLK